MSIINSYYAVALWRIRETLFSNVKSIRVIHYHREPEKLLHNDEHTGVTFYIRHTRDLTPAVVSRIKNPACGK